MIAGLEPQQRFESSARRPAAPGRGFGGGNAGGNAGAGRGGHTGQRANTSWGARAEGSRDRPQFADRKPGFARPEGKAFGGARDGQKRVVRRAA